MARYIDAEELCRRLNECWETNDIDKGRIIQQVIDRVITPIVVGTPTADVEEVKHGRWHTARKTKLSKTVQCTACDMDFYFKVKGQLNIDMCPRCPNCGAKMDGGKEE